MLHIAIPMWAALGLAAALISTAIPLIQEKLRADGFALAFLVKLVSAVLIFPFVLKQGFPSNPEFYGMAALTSLLWAISDVIYFRSVPLAGAGVVSRLLPSAVLISFLLWFLVDPSLLDKYIEEPVQGGLIAAIILLSAWFATRLRKCKFSWAGFRMVWFVIFAACIGPLIEKVTLGTAPSKQAPIAFVFVQASFMMFFWAVYFFIRKPIALRTLFSPLSLTAGILIGACSAAAVTLRFEALQRTEHPAYLSVLLFTDALWIVAFHRLTGKQDSSNVSAGLGIVFCAVALILVKSIDFAAFQ